MSPAEHREKAEKIELSMAKLGPDDYEMAIEGAMLAGTHWLNCALHEQGASSATDDVLHTYMLTVNALRKLRVADAARVDALTEIEDIRPPFVRGDYPGGAAAATRSLVLLARIRTGA